VRVRAILLPVALAIVGCSKASTDVAVAASSSAASAPSPASPPSSGPAPSASAAPPIRETAAPPAERVGVLAPNTGVPVGQKAPDFHARDLDGKDVAFSSIYAKGPVLLAFYRGGWCPYCNSEIHALTTAYPDYQKRGVTPVAISVDKPDAEAKMKALYTIPFPVLSDSDAKIIEAFHVVNKVDGEQLAKMRGFGVDLESYSGQTHHEIAIPALFLIDRAGVVRWAHSDPDFKVRPSTAQILAAIDAAHLSGK
jgi:peroxiredoxin